MGDLTREEGRWCGFWCVASGMVGVWQPGNMKTNGSRVIRGYKGGKTELWWPEKRYKSLEVCRWCRRTGMADERSCYWTIGIRVTINAMVSCHVLPLQSWVTECLGSPRSPTGGNWCILEWVKATVVCFIVWFVLGGVLVVMAVVYWWQTCWWPGRECKQLGGEV